MKSIVEFSKKNDYINVEKLTKSFTDVEYQLFLKSHFSSVDPQIFSHDISKRKKRDDFFNKLKVFCLDNNLMQSGQYIKNKHDVAIHAEIMYDEIKESLRQSPISKCSLSEQCWGYVDRAFKEIVEIKKYSRKVFSEKIKEKGGVFISDRKLEDESGNEYDADYAIESIVSALSLTLSMLGHQHGLFINGIIELPEKINASEEICNKSSAIQMYAVAWGRLEESSNRCVLFDGATQELTGEDVQGDARSVGIVRTINIEPNFSLFEKIVFISSSRNVEINSQVFYEAVLNSDLEDLIVKDISEIRNLNDGQYLSEGEATSLISLSNIYCEDMFKSKEEYRGLTVKEWVRGYACLQYLVGSTQDNSNYMYDKETLIDVLVCGGLLENKANIFLLFVLYGKESRDLYDCPVVKVSNEGYFIFHEVIADMSIFSTLLSQFSNLNIEFKNKGFKFEEDVIEKLRSKKIEVRDFKFKRGLDEYEYDAVFIMDTRVFVVECKNRSLPGWNSVRSSRYKKFMNDTALQVKRLVKGLKLYPDIFFNEFGKNISDFEVVPLVLNCLPFSYPGKYDEVYFSDISSFGLFLKSKNVSFKEYRGVGNVVGEHSIYEQWESDRPMSSDLIKQLELPVQIKVYLNSLEAKGYWLPASTNNAFSIKELSVNLQRGLECEFGIKKLTGNH